MANLQIQIYIITGVFGSLLLLLILGLLYLTLLLRRLVVSSKVFGSLLFLLILGLLYLTLLLRRLVVSCKSDLRFLSLSFSTSSWASSTSTSSTGG